MAGSTPTVLQGTLELMLLAGLARGPLHAYGLARSVEHLCGGVLVIEEGSLYPALKRLEKRGDVTSRWTTTATGRRGRLFSITHQGRDGLDEQSALWRTTRDAVDRVLGHALYAP